MTVHIPPHSFHCIRNPQLLSISSSSSNVEKIPVDASATIAKAYCVDAVSVGVYEIIFSTQRPTHGAQLEGRLEWLYMLVALKRPSLCCSAHITFKIIAHFLVYHSSVCLSRRDTSTRKRGEELK